MKAKGAVLVEKESAKIDLYKDPRMGGENFPEDTIITCKHFLDAVENDLYGWRWVCPNNGIKCHFRHMLPEGYVLLTKAEREAQLKYERENPETRTLEEQIEEDRMALSSEGLTPVTEQSFKEWKERRAAKKQEELIQKLKEEEAAIKGKGGKGKAHGIMSGRALFQYNPNLFQDDENAGDADDYEEGGLA